MINTNDPNPSRGAQRDPGGDAAMNDRIDGLQSYGEDVASEVHGLRTVVETYNENLGRFATAVENMSKLYARVGSIETENATRAKRYSRLWVLSLIIIVVVSTAFFITERVLILEQCKARNESNAAVSQLIKATLEREVALTPGDPWIPDLQQFISSSASVKCSFV